MKKLSASVLAAGILCMTVSVPVLAQTNSPAVAPAASPSAAPSATPVPAKKKKKKSTGLTDNPAVSGTSGDTVETGAGSPFSRGLHMYPSPSASPSAAPSPSAT